MEKILIINKILIIIYLKEKIIEMKIKKKNQIYIKIIKKIKMSQIIMRKILLRKNQKKKGLKVLLE